MSKICIKCNQKDLEWVKDRDKWKLYDPETGQFHECKVTKQDFAIVDNTKKNLKQSCWHGILRDNWCDKCEEARND